MRRMGIIAAIAGFFAIGYLLYSLYSTAIAIHQLDMVFARALKLVDELSSESRRLAAVTHRATVGVGEHAEKDYRDILDIRHGRAARSAANFIAPGQIISFMHLAESMPFTAGEMALLRKAYEESEALVAVELEAIRLSRAGEDISRAVRLMTGPEYAQRLVDISRMLEGLSQQLVVRLTAENEVLHGQLKARIAILCLVLFLVVGGILVLRHMGDFHTGVGGDDANRWLYLYTALLLSLSLLVPIWFIYKDAHSILLTTLENRENTICTNVHTELMQRIKQIQEIMEGIASFPLIQKYASQANVGRLEEATREEGRKTLLTFRSAYMDIDSMGFVDRDGRLLNDTDDNARRQDWRLPEAVLARVLAGRVYVGVLSNQGAEQEEPVVITPIYGLRKEQGRVIGALLSFLDTRRSFRIWETRQSPEERMDIFVVNSKGKVVLSSRQEAGSEIAAEHAAAAGLVRQGVEGLRYYTDEQGNERVGVFRQIPELGWTVVVSSEVSKLTSSVNDILVRAIVFGAMAMLCAILLFSWIMHRMTLNLRDANDRMANLIQNSGMFKWNMDLEAYTFTFDAQWLRLLGYPDPRDGWWTLDEYNVRWHPNTRISAEFLGQGIARDGFGVFEGRVRTFSGDWLWIKLIARVDKVGGQGEPLCLSGTGADITGQKTLEQSEAQLEALVTQRTAELEESRNQAQAASLAKSAFLSTVSHEIRTPMNAIVGFARIFERSNLTAIQKEQLEKIKLSASTLLGIINDVLDFSKIEADKLELEAAPFHVHQLLDTVCSIVGFAAVEKGLDLSVDIRPEVPNMLMGDHKRISQVLLNLLNNAVKFTDRGGVDLCVGIQQAPAAQTLEDESDDSVTLTISVTDTGIGLSQEQVERLFKPFMQADSSITRRFGGTGLGLAITKQLVELMGGDINVRSELGKGSVFSLTLRLSRCPEGTDLLAANFFKAEDAASPELQLALSLLAGKEVLLVEDNEINQEIATALLQEYGLRVDVAENGRVALDMAVTKRYACIFMDMQMPVMDGLEATRRLRSLGQRACEDADPDELLRYLAYVPIVAMTANAMTEDRQRCLEAGMVGHIAKPIEIDALRNALVTWLAQDEPLLAE